ncbi:MFS transporter [Pseudaquabacterium pictum]|uniref:Nitrite extrusion protein n=1 Tax=Pseudaquabacterium pictum TaxID=2315236 RepID=A0A480AX67_9BURK|nr:MFS transporter [Rubrivivax pictus]GCL65486.1 nitrite extrusion protein [Rubrivivax pictus]
MTSMTIIQHWNPEDRKFWDLSGRAVARRNLWVSVPALALAFAVWMLWSVVVVHLPAAGFRYSTNQLFWLTALPALCGATLRIFYAFAVPMIGGRRFTTLATASLLVPAVGIGLAVQDPNTPFEWMVVLALLCGLGGGNFASSMANISFFFPSARQGYALGLNAGLGHLGVALVQLLVPLAISAGVFGVFSGPAQQTVEGPMWLQNAGFIWVPLILASTATAWFGMDDLAATHAGMAQQAVIFTRRHNWLMCWLYLGTFGSFIGFSASLPMLAQSQFQRADALHLVWLGPLIGAVLRPLGGWMADHWGGARVTFWIFVAMALAASAALLFLPATDTTGQPGHGGNFPGFLAAFGVLFAASGIGNGSTFRMISSLFVAERVQRAGGLPSDQVLAAKEGAVEAAAALGFASAIGAYGGFFIPKSVGSSLAMTGSASAALVMFIVFYLSCIALTWWAYSRRNAPYPC